MYRRSKQDANLFWCNHTHTLVDFYNSKDDVSSLCMASYCNKISLLVFYPSPVQYCWCCSSQCMHRDICNMSHKKIIPAILLPLPPSTSKFCFLCFSLPDCLSPRCVQREVGLFTLTQSYCTCLVPQGTRQADTQHFSFSDLKPLKLQMLCETEPTSAVALAK